MDRKLATIFASDVVGFSKMMGTDEVKTLKIYAIPLIWRLKYGIKARSETIPIITTKILDLYLALLCTAFGAIWDINIW